MTYEIKKNTPVPPSREAYPFAEMDVGDMFSVEDKTVFRKLQSAAHIHGKMYNKKFITRSSPTGGACWRVK